MENQENQISTVVKNSNVSTQLANDLESGFAPLLAQAKGWAARAGEIMITDASQVNDMELARNYRLELKKIRCETETRRKAKKAEYVSVGKAIDGVSNIIKALIVPIEAELFEKENYAVNLENARLNKLAIDRAEQLRKFNVDPEAYNLRVMTDEVFNTQIEMAEKNFKAAEKEEIKRQAAEDKKKSARKIV